MRFHPSCKFMLATAVMLILLAAPLHAAQPVITVGGAVKTPLELSLEDLQRMPSFHMSNIALIDEKTAAGDPDKLTGTARYTGVLLRDILEKAGMVHVRKWEPGVFFRVRGAGGKEDVFSFGEIFYSSIGRSILIAYEKDGVGLNPSDGLGELIVGTDVRMGRKISGVREIVVERVNISMHAYEDKKNKVERPATEHFVVSDIKSGKKLELRLKDLQSLPCVHIQDGIFNGDCEGFKGVHDFDGVPLRLLLEKLGIAWSGAISSRYVVAQSEDGFCSTYSLGELFNSRLGYDNIIVAHTRDGAALQSKYGCAMTVVREDGVGGRSVKRISRIDIF